MVAVKAEVKAEVQVEEMEAERVAEARVVAAKEEATGVAGKEVEEKVATRVMMMAEVRAAAREAGGKVAEAKVVEMEEI